MDATLLIHWHLIFLEIEVRDSLLKHTHHEVMRELVLIREAGGLDGLKACQKIHVGLMTAGDGIVRQICKLVVIAIIAKGGGSLREVPLIGFVLFFKKSVLDG